MAVTFEQLRAMFTEGLPLVREMGITLEDMGYGEVVMRLPFRADWIGDPDSGVIHGGAVSVLLDTTMGGAVFAHPENAAGTATIDLRINYMRPARPGAVITARGKVSHVTRTVAFVNGSAWDDSEQNPVATATGTFTFTRKDAA